tara:strand:+ start:16735 stop:17235 length:501 start_codon:yes stop_codon:yes gene_type:complete
MASFAQLDENNHVIDIIKIANDGDILDSNGIENENLGIEKCMSLFGSDTVWKQTWYGNNPRRFRTAVVDGEYDQQHDVFTKRRPYPSWTLDGTTYLWEPPTPRPESIEGKIWGWDESTVSWVGEDVSKPSNPLNDENVEIAGDYIWNIEGNWDWVPEPVEEETTEE